MPHLLGDNLMKAGQVFGASSPISGRFGLAVCRMAWFCLAITVCISSSPRVSRAEEPVQAFLDELRNQGYFEEALEYLEEMRTSPVSPVNFRDVVDFERAKTLFLSLSTVRERARQEAILDESQAALDKFITERRTHPMAADATEMLAGLLLRRSDIALEKSNQEGVAEGQKTVLRDQARQQLAKAEQIFVQVQEDLKQRLMRIDPKTSDPQLKAMLADYRVRYMQIKLALPQIKLSTAETHDPQAPERGGLLANAETEFNAVRTAYRSFGGTYLLATVGMAQAMQLQGKNDEALTYLEEVFGLPNAAELRDAKRRALIIALACYRTKQPLPYEEMLKRAEPVVGVLMPAEVDDPDYLTLQLELAGLYHDAADALEAKEPKTPEDRTKITEYDNRAEDIVREMTRSSGPLKAAAQQLLATWGQSRAPVASEQGEVANFIQARDRGVAVLTDYDNARVALETLQVQLASEPDATRKAEIEAKIEQSTQVLRTAPIEAMKWFEQALSLADAETPADDLAIVRRYIAYLFFVEGKYHHAGVIGEHQLQTAPGAAGAKASASIALNAYWALFQEAPADQRAFEVEHLKSVGELTIRNFPDSEEAIRAANVLAFVSLSQKDLAAARAYLNQIPETSPERVRTRLLIGTQIWSDYLKQLAEIDGSRRAGVIEVSEADASKAALAPLRAEARADLESGVLSLAAADMDSSMISATLALAQIALMDNRAADAVALFERPDAGLLNLVKQKHPVASEPERLANIYRTGLRAYIGSLASAPDKASQIQKARSIMTALAESVGATPEGRKQLVSLYISLVADLRLQMGALPDKEQRLAFGNGVATFLDEVQRGASDPSLLVWTAETLASVAGSMADDGFAPDANRLYASAEAILKQVTEGNAEADLKRRASIQQAGILRSQGKYEESVEAYADLLEANPAMVSVQVDAAMAYHQWGRATRSSETLGSAMTGGMPRENPQTKRNENVIWGWGKLAQATARNPQYREIFFQARYQLAYARFEYAVLTSSNEQLARVKRDIQGTMQVDPQLGGANWTAKFDALAKALQKQLGEPQVGLGALKP